MCCVAPLTRPSAAATRPSSLHERCACATSSRARAADVLTVESRATASTWFSPCEHRLRAWPHIASEAAMPASTDIDAETLEFAGFSSSACSSAARDARGFAIIKETVSAGLRELAATAA